MASSWQNNPLFKRASAAIAQKARTELRATPIGRLAKELTELTRRPNSLATAGRRDDFEKLLLDAARRKLIPGFDLAAVERKVAQVTRYSLGDFALNALFDALGPLGGILKDLSKITKPGREQSRDRDVEAAINFLSTMGFEVISKPGQRKPSARQQNIAAAILEAAGWTVFAPGQGPAQVARPGRTPRPRKRPRVIDDAPPTDEPPQAIGDSGTGTSDALWPPKPRREGEPAGLEKVSSTNVWAIGFNNNTRTLYVQFRAPTVRSGAIRRKAQKSTKKKIHTRHQGKLGSTVVGRANAPGPIYAYYDVPPSVARKVIKDAKSGEAGEAVWDYLRIRGTVHGHRYDYRLSSPGSEAIVVNDKNEVTGRIHYVPRKAVHTGMFQQRSMAVGRDRRTGKLHVVRSLLPNEGLGPKSGHGRSQGLGPVGPTGPGLR